MAVREIIKLGNPLLRTVCKHVEDPTSKEIASLVQDLFDTLANARASTGYGRGIAAPQIGECRRVIYFNIPGLSPFTMVNPEITWRSKETMIVWDACLSFLSIFMQVERHREVRVRYQDLLGSWHEMNAGVDHDLSELFQHEIDHLDGILAIDKVVDLKSVCSKEEFELRYRKNSPYAAAV